MRKHLCALLALLCLLLLCGCAPQQQAAATALATDMYTPLPTALRSDAAQSTVVPAQTYMAKPTVTAKARPAVTAAPSLQPVQSATIPTPSVPVPTATPQQRVRCTVSVDCKTAVEAGYEPAIQLSTSGVMLSTAVEVAPGSSVYDALTAAAKQTGIPIGTSGSGKRVYIVSICSLAERDFGTKSGWMYSVNGQYPSVSCGARTVLDGDRIAFRYTLNLGKDLGASVQ